MDKRVDSDIKNTLDHATGKVVDEVGDKAEKAGIKMHGLHAIIRTVGTQFPGLERFGRFMGDSFTATLGIVALAAIAFKASLDDLVSSLADLSTGAGAASDVVDKNREAADKSAISYNVWKYEIDRTTEAQETLKQKTDELIERLKSLADTQAEVAKSEDDLRAARIDLAEKLGAISKPQAIKLKLELDESEFQEHLNAKVAAIQAQLGTRQTEQNTAIGNANMEGMQVDAAKRKADEANAAKQANDSKIEQDKKNLEDTKSLAQKNQDWLDDHAKDLMSPIKSPERVEMEARKNAVDSMQSQMVALQHSIKQEEKKAVPLGTAAETAKSDYEYAKQQYADAAKEAHDLGSELRKLTGDLAAAKAEAAALIPLHNAAAQTRAASEMADYYKQQERGPDWMIHSRSGQEDPRLVGVDASQLQRTVAQAQTRIQTGQMGQEEHQALLDQATVLLESLSQHPALAGHSDIKRRLDDVERTLSNHQYRLDSGNINNQR